MDHKNTVALCLCLALLAGLAIAPLAARAELREAELGPNLSQLMPLYRQTVTDPQYMGLKKQLEGHMNDRAVVDRYLEYLPISPLTMLQIDMKLKRYEHQIPSRVWQWHQRWLALHPQLAEKLYQVETPPRERALTSPEALASETSGPQAMQAAATVGTNHNAAYDYPLPPEEYQGEIQMVVNPADTTQIVAGANTWDDQNGACGDYGLQAVFFSSDGGTTWGYSCPPDAPDYGLDCAQFSGGTFGSDPALAWTADGRVMLEYMLLCDNGSTTNYAIVDAISADGGATWSPQGVVIDSYGTGNLEDKNFYAIDTHAGSPYSGRHYTCWDRANDEKSAYSSDDGQTWTEVDLPATAGAASGCSAKGPTARYDLGCEMAVGKDGTVHLVYDTITCGRNSCSCEQMFYTQSTDGGASWAAPTQVRKFNLAGFSNDSTPAVQDQRGISPFGAIDIDNSGGSCDGNLYVTFTDHTGGGAATSDVWLTRSTDNGSSWSSAIKVNDDATSNTQFHPFLVVDQSNGSPVIAWHDARNDPNNEAIDYFVTRSTDCGASVEANTQVSAPSAEFNNATISYSNQSSTANANYNPNQYGEYLGLDAHSGMAYLAWSDTRHFFPGSTGETQQENVGFARVDLGTTGGGDTTPPAAPTGLTASAGDGQVSLDWADNGEADLAGYTVYRSTTSGSGYAAVTGSLLGTSAYTDTTVTNGTTYYYVVTASDTSANESGFSNEASATPQGSTGGPTTMHVASITVGTRNAGGGQKYARATVTLVDDQGNPVGSATVTGTFSGDVSGTDSGATGGSGSVTLETGPTKGRLNFTFCVDSVSHSTLTYDAGANAQTCVSG